LSQWYKNVWDFDEGYYIKQNWLTASM
jgi:hypothetical protein